MKCYLAGYNYKKQIMDQLDIDEINKVYILESFYYITDWQKEFIKEGLFKDFMLDSGAFTFMENSNKDVSWDEYLNKYIDFINEYDIDYFFELDVDSIVGLDKVRQMRNKLEVETGKDSIPVWHINRGKENFIKLTKEYDYIAYGAFMTDGISRNKNLKYLPWFIKKAHDNDCKIHLLGYTGKDLHKLNADSVDSSSWTFGNRGKFLFEFDGKKMNKKDLSDRKKRMDAKKIAIHNFKEWVKYQQYLDGGNY